MKRSLFGYGRTTKALAKLGGWDIYDDSFTCKEVDGYTNTLLPPSEFKAKESTLEIPSPGFPPNHPLVLNAHNLISEYDFFASKMPYSIWISGTNGKTTTTQMIAHLLAPQGAVAGGNIGTPLAELDPKASLWVLETSSFTLHYTNRAKPDMYVLLPIKPDHLSWHGDFESYANAKLKPLSSMRDGSVALLPSKYANIPTKAHVIAYENSDDLAKFLGIDIGELTIKEPFLMDALLALCVQYIITGQYKTKMMESFVLDPHKLQELHDSKGRLWVNDTKGTNVDATIEALRRYKNYEIHIILGGDDKGVSLEALFEELKPLHVKIYAIGSNTDKLISLAQRYSIKATAYYTLNKAVDAIDLALDKNGVGLLSPAASSLDQFSSYIQRGEDFIAQINTISSS
jgi:UDP-N-acetylmuramoylalanine--D-glutamate ligase